MKRTLFTLLGTCLASTTLGLSLAAGVHAQEVMLKGSQVTESALIDALAIDGPQAPDGATTRGFRPATRPGQTASKPGPGKASLLITFTSNSSNLTPETMTTLDTVARALQSDTLAGFSFRVEGHADPLGNADRNLVLSQQRAESVAKYLVDKHAILVERLSPVGKGSSELMNRARADAPENRRVTIVTIKG